jgi:hypothetical protein
LGNYCAAHVQRSAFSQIITESDHINDVTCTNQSPQKIQRNKTRDYDCLQGTHLQALGATRNGTQGALIFESIPKKAFSTIASGDTTIESTRRAPDNITTKIKQLQRYEKNSILEPLLEKLSTIASGATPIVSVGRAPDEISDSKSNKEGGKKNFKYLLLIRLKRIYNF